MTDPPRGIAFLGFGLIGGSIARALAGRIAGSRPSIAAWSPRGVGPRAAVADGVIDRAAEDAAGVLRDADLVVIAAPPIETIELVERLGGDLRPALAPDALVTDVASTKAAILTAALRAGIAYVGGHPMAGREATGYAASDADLFRDRPWVVVVPPGTEPRATGRIEWLAAACGARPVHLDAEAHDAAVAAISHLPLVASAALVEAVAGDAGSWPLARSLAASGWTGMTRLAAGDPRMAAGIAATNAGPIALRLRAYRDALDRWLTTLESGSPPDVEALEARLAIARARLLEEREPPSGSDAPGA